MPRANSAAILPAMRIAVTGSTGFIGGYLAHALAGAGHELRLLVRPMSASPHSLRLFNLHEA